MSDKINDNFEVAASSRLRIFLIVGVFVATSIFLFVFFMDEDANTVAGICMLCTLLLLFIMPCVIICKQRLVVQGNTITFFSAFKKPYRFDVNEITKVIWRASYVIEQSEYYNMAICTNKKRISVDTFMDGYFDIQTYIYDKVDAAKIIEKDRR